MLIPGRLGSASVGTEIGEIEVRMSDGGNWQLRGRLTGEESWRLLCRGHLDGSVFEPLNTIAPLTLGPLRVEPEARRAVVKGKPVRLTRREFGLLAFLATKPTHVFAKPELLRRVWGDRGASRTRTLDSHASRVRRKLEVAGAPGFVINCRAYGYKLSDTEAED